MTLWKVVLIALVVIAADKVLGLSDIPAGLLGGLTKKTA